MSLQPDSAMVGAVHASPNIDERRGGMRPYLLILHYTGLPTVERSIAVLADPRCKVSCHYVIGLDGRVTQMVGEDKRGWHAGVSHWRGETDINSASIGIEIQNPGHNDGYPAFPVVQMIAVRDLALDICGRNGIRQDGVLAHSDVAPGRKIDPGERFDWGWLARAGVGHWVAPEPLGWDEGVLQQGCKGERVAGLQRRLAAYGYGLEASGRYDERTRNVVAAFQLHFRPARVDGRFDRSTAATLERLIGGLPRP